MNDIQKTVTHTTAPCTEKQVTFIAKLVQSRELNSVLQNKVSAARKLVMGGRLTRLGASHLIDALLDAPLTSTYSEQPLRSDHAPEPQAGVYRNGDMLVRVYKGQQNGRMLVKEILSEGTEVQYAYRGTARSFLTDSFVRLSLAEVGSLGKSFEHCLICGRRLDDPESVDRGIGPVCASRY